MVFFFFKLVYNWVLFTCAATAALQRKVTVWPFAYCTGCTGNVGLGAPGGGQNGPFSVILYVDIAPIIEYAAPGTMDTPGAGTVRGRENVTLMALLAPFTTGPPTFESWLGRQGGCA